MEPEGSLTCSQDPDTDTFTPYFLTPIFILFSNVHPYFTQLASSRDVSWLKCAILFSVMRIVFMCICMYYKERIITIIRALKRYMFLTADQWLQDGAARYPSSTCVNTVT
jgi:hypothetical protein